LFAEVIQDAVNLVRGVRHANSTGPSKPADVTAALAWIRDGNVGVVSFNQACGLSRMGRRAREAGNPFCRVRCLSGRIG
jgi:hypothetical protein